MRKQTWKRHLALAACAACMIGSFSMTANAEISDDLWECSTYRDENNDIVIDFTEVQTVLPASWAKNARSSPPRITRASTIRSPASSGRRSLATRTADICSPSASARSMTSPICPLIICLGKRRTDTIFLNIRPTIRLMRRMWRLQMISTP